MVNIHKKMQKRAKISQYLVDGTNDVKLGTQKTPETSKTESGVFRRMAKTGKIIDVPIIHARWKWKLDD